MKLSAYIVVHDTGFAPNPFGRICTLACCKPTIRRNAKPGDVVIGTGSSRHKLENRLIYAMKVGKVVPLEEYWWDYPSKRPSDESPIKSCGDNIWVLNGNHWKLAPNAHHDEGFKILDVVRGRNVLISSEFYYFGKDSIEIPRAFASMVATSRGHKNTVDQDLIERFWMWLRNNQRKQGRLGMPRRFEAANCDRRSSPSERDVSIPESNRVSEANVRQKC